MTLTIDHSGIYVVTGPKYLDELFNLSSSESQICQSYPVCIVTDLVAEEINQAF